MKDQTRIGIGCLIGVLTLLWYGAGPVGAVPSETCRDLADRFANTPAQLDARYLTALVLCVSTEVGDRVGVAQVIPPESLQSQETSPAPVAPPEASPPPRRDYGVWPPPPAWGEEWPAASWYEP